VKALADAGDDASNKCIDELMEALDAFIPEPKRALDKPFLMPIETCSRSRAADGGDGSGGAGDREGRRRGGDRRIKDTKKTVVTGVEMFRKLLTRAGGGQHRALLRGVDKEDVERGQCWRSRARSRRTRSSRRRPYILTKDEGGSSHAVLQRLPAPVLLPHDGRDGGGESSGRDRDGDAGDNVEMVVELITPHRDGQGAALSRSAKAGRTVGSGSSPEIISNASGARRGVLANGRALFPEDRIRMKAYDFKLLDQSVGEIVDTALRTGGPRGGSIRAPHQHQTASRAAGAHIDKKSREQFEIRTHKRLIDILDRRPRPWTR